MPNDYEEIGLGGNQPRQPQTPSEAPSEAPKRKASIEDLISPSASNEDVIDAVLAAPDDRLIPWESCTLPSRGMFYDWGTGVVQVHGMGLMTDKILATQRLAQSGESIDHVFRECVRFPDPSFDAMDLLVGDRVFLLYYLRGITHGNIYEFAITCPNPACASTSTHSYDLNEQAKTIKWADPTLGQEPFRVTLPYLSEVTGREFWVGLRFLRGRDTNNMVATRRMRKKVTAAPSVRAGRDSQVMNGHSNVIIDETLSENLQLIVTDVLGVTDRMRVHGTIERLHARDTATIREWLKDNSPGIDTAVTLNCPDCGQAFTTELPITESFFRPTPAR